MNKIKNSVTTSVQVAITATAHATATGVSGSAVDMRGCRNAIAKAIVTKHPSSAGNGAVITMSLYECQYSNTTGGTIVTSSTVTGAVSGSANTYLETEIKADDMSCNASKRYLFAHINADTKSEMVVTIERGMNRYDPQD